MGVWLSAMGMKASQVLVKCPVICESHFRRPEDYHIRDPGAQWRLLKTAVPSLNPWRPAEDESGIKDPHLENEIEIKEEMIE